MRHRHVLVALGLGLVLVLGASQGAVHGDDLGSARRPPIGSVRWLSTGDSYSSGEGIAGTGVGNDRCAQSDEAFGPLAADVLRFSRRWSIQPEAFTACTGAVVTDFYRGRGRSLWDWTKDQVQGSEADFRVITMSFGGNDIGFADVVRDCVALPDDWGDLLDDGVLGDRCDRDLDEISDAIRALADEGRFEPIGPGNSPARNQTGSISDFFELVASNHLTRDGVLTVVGYPRLFTPSEDWGAWRGDRCELIDSEDADHLGELAEELDDVLEEAVEQADPQAGQIRYISRVELFDDGGRSHSLCTRLSEWLNGVTLGIADGSGRMEHSFHPNELGHRATAIEVARSLNEELGRPPAPAPPDEPDQPDPTAPPATAPPPVDEPDLALYDIGDEFDERCVVAWPIAPVRGVDSIQMRLSCAAVSSQYFFVDVIYPDPDLPLSQLSQGFGVHGEIVDIGESELGFRVLVVVADELDF